MTIREFLKKNEDGYDRYRTLGEWKGYKVYQIWAKRQEGCCIGLPQFALEKDGVFRIAAFDEINELMDLM